ncbi:MAG: hypothetical protein QM831_08855 [Kofleriaceae bacterium]
MSKDDDDEITATERAQAKTFAELVDKALAGRTPKVMSADDRALLEVATVIRATKGTIELGAEQRSSIIESALKKAVGDTKQPAAIAVVPIGRAKKPAVRAPWIVAGASMVVAAAAVVLWLRAPHRAVAPPPATAVLPENQTMRPTDPLIGPISHEHGDTTARIDTIFADRLDGYRDRRFGGTR